MVVLRVRDVYSLRTRTIGFEVEIALSRRSEEIPSVTSIRHLTLIFGPLVLVAAAHALAMPRWNDGFSRRDAEAAALVAASPPAASAAELARDCQQTAERLSARLGSNCNVVVRPPFVVAGDRSAEGLNAYCRDTIEPVARALWTCYFDHKPDRPVSLVLLSDEKTYRQEAQRLDGEERSAYYGYIQRDERRIVINLATGDGTLAHELTHALSSFDFPDMPEWFDEGLAALHEESDFSDDGLQLTGLHNWRLALLRDAQQRNSAPSLEWLVKNHSFRGEGEGLNYALVRYFCMYLQDRDMLSHFYRKFRGNVGNDPEGLETLRVLLGVESAAEIDRDFAAWLRTLPPAPKP